MQNIFAKLVPFIVAGIAIVAFAFGLLLLAYLLIFGAIVGLGLFAFSWVRRRFFSSKQMVKPTTKQKEQQGRIIDHDDNK